MQIHYLVYNMLTLVPAQNHMNPVQYSIYAEVFDVVSLLGVIRIKFECVRYYHFDPIF
jgi:hypothetical protein